MFEFFFWIAMIDCLGGFLMFMAMIYANANYKMFRFMVYWPDQLKEWWFSLCVALMCVGVGTFVNLGLWSVWQWL